MALKHFALPMYLLILMGALFGGSSCGTTRGLLYMEGSFDTAKLRMVNAIEPTIRKGDLLQIIVYSDNPDATKIFNQSLITTSTGGAFASTVNGGISQSSIGGSPGSPGYQVDANGNIIFQGLGKLHVEGLTKAALKDTLDARLVKYLNNPYYNIRFLNYRFTMLGEVSHPGVQTIPGERLNLLEAIALAGDLTNYARRDNILILRDSSGVRQWKRLDVTKPEMMSSPFFYIQQNDIVIVEPTKKKAPSVDVLTTRNLGIATGILSIAVLIYTIVRLN